MSVIEFELKRQRHEEEKAERREATQEKPRDKTRTEEARRADADRKDRQDIPAARHAGIP